MRAARANRVFCADENRIRTENTVLDKTRTARGFVQDRRLRADVLFIRAQSTIRADGPPSAQAQAPKSEVSSDVCRYREAALRAARANRDFGTDMKRIRTKITVMDKSNNGFGLLLSKIVDYVRTCFFIRAQSTTARTDFRPRN
ncbi:MAG: hypothetical protein HY848_14870 [Betaproteobacteria bacterium]|nr:hypothetical protein [Betaproteobacteria bacterium]